MPGMVKIRPTAKVFARIIRQGFYAMGVLFLLAASLYKLKVI
jgi:hypothetical protein